MISRLAKLQPWYHQPMPRCQALIVAKGERCIYSARYTDVAGKGLELCKTHADMADFPVKPLRPQMVVLR
jgi:hypothetical protein